MQQDRPASLSGILAACGDLSGRHLLGADGSIALEDLAGGAVLQGHAAGFSGTSVLLRTRSQVATASALIALDGLAARIVICPPNLSPEHIPAIVSAADVDAGVTDDASLLEGLPDSTPRTLCVATAANPLSHPGSDTGSDGGLDRGSGPVRSRRTEWVLLTSGTTGMPKLVVHTLGSLTDAIPPTPAGRETVWSTLYDIRRYGGMQIFLRAILGGASMVLSDAGGSTGEFLARAAGSGVTHISGTPSQWRRVLISAPDPDIQPRYIRLSGEIADQAVLNELRERYPEARIAHAFASTEAGVAFEVTDGQMGFPAELLEAAPGVEMKIEGRTLRVRSGRTAARYLNQEENPLKDAEGFVDTGDAVESRSGRCYFVGRHDGTVNVGGLKVHPEEVEAVLNRHPGVSVSLVRSKKNPITGALVVADVVLRGAELPADDEAHMVKGAILDFCRAELEPYKVPVLINFVSSLAVGESGKLVRLRA